MAKNVEIVNNFEWSEALGCPPSVCTSHVKKILNHGFTGLWWEQVGSLIYPLDDVSETRKNILLYYLRNQGQVPAIQNIRNAQRLEAERNLLEPQIANLHAECEKREASIKEKALKLAKLRAARKTVEQKRNLLDYSYNEMKNKLKDVNYMRTVCQDLLPPSQLGINDNTMAECLAVVGAISSREDKKNAWKRILESLGPTAISELWDWILKNRLQNKDELCNLRVDEKLKVSSHKPTVLDIGIAKAHGEKVALTIAKFIHLQKGDMYAERGMEYLEKIAELASSEELTEWLTTVMEVTKFEAVQKVLQAEIEKVKHFSEDQNDISLELHQIESDMNDIDLEMELKAQALRKSLNLLESAGNYLLTKKDQLSITLNSIVQLNSQLAAAPDWMNDNLSHELQFFQESLNLNALSKIMLGGKLGAYRHSTTTMSNALISFPTLTSATPIFHAPLYHLINCYLALNANKMLKQKKQESEIASQVDLNLKSSIPSFTREADIVQTLDEANVATKKCQQEISDFNSIYDAWCYQPVQEVMAINEDTVHGATFNEWIQRYTTLIYMLQRSK